MIKPTINLLNQCPTKLLYSHSQISSVQVLKSNVYFIIQVSSIDKQAFLVELLLTGFEPIVTLLFWPLKCRGISIHLPHLYLPIAMQLVKWGMPLYREFIFQTEGDLSGTWQGLTITFSERSRFGT